MLNIVQTILDNWQRDSDCYILKIIKEKMLQQEQCFNVPLQNNQMNLSTAVQGLSVPFACIGSGDPVRVLHPYTTNTLSTLQSIYYWDICTTCCYRIYVLCAQALWLWDFLLLIPTSHWLSGECAPTLYCVVAYIAACVDTSRTVFWDFSVLR